MKFSINYSSISTMLQLCEKSKKGILEESEVRQLLSHEDYMFEFSRYKGRVSEDEFTGYLLNFPRLTEDSITNEDLKIHHRYYMYLLDNLDMYFEKEKELERMFTREIFEEQINRALKGLPDGFVLPELKFIFTVGIGQSFGYAHGNGMHFDFLQLIKDESLEEFCSVIAHEVHHVGTGTLYDSMGLDRLPLEQQFYVYFSGEGLAVKYCNNVEGVISKPIYSGPKNIGLDDFTWKYLNNDFDNTMVQFKETIRKMRNGEVNTSEQFITLLEEYWMNPLAEGQKKGDIPKLKQFRLYSFGNDIWGVIHDCFGKEKVYETLKNPQKFPEVYNEAVKKIGRADLQI